MDKPMFSLIYHDGNVCVYKDTTPLLSLSLFDKKKIWSIKSLCERGLNVMYKMILKDEIDFEDINKDKDVQNYIDDMESLLK